jgi:hypothetical protein
MLGLVTRVKAVRRRTRTLFEPNLEVDTLSGRSAATVWIAAGHRPASTYRMMGHGP